MQSVTHHPPTLGSDDQFLGPGLDHVQRPRSEVDDIDVQIRAHPPNVARFEDMQSEADVVRFFYQQIKPTFRPAFSGEPYLSARSQVGPTGQPIQLSLSTTS